MQREILHGCGHRSLGAGRALLLRRRVLVAQLHLADELPQVRQLDLPIRVWVELLQHLFRPMWRMFPTDSMLQKVAAKSELSKLLESERSRDSLKPVKKGKVADSGGASDAAPSFCNQGAPSASAAMPAGTPSKDLDLVPFEA